jgi:hypothetical protein
MPPGFRRSGGRIVTRLQRVEVVVLRELVAEVQQLMAPDVERNAVTDRLFPAASDDPVAAQELRELIEDDLREGKRAAARTLLDSLPDDSGRVELDAEAAEQWLTALNDVRLALGTAIGYTEAMYDEDSDDPDLVRMEWLAMLQSTLLRALAGPGIDGEL